MASTELPESLLLLRSRLRLRYELGTVSHLFYVLTIISRILFDSIENTFHNVSITNAKRNSADELRENKAHELYVFLIFRKFQTIMDPVEVRFLSSSN